MVVLREIHKLILPGILVTLCILGLSLPAISGRRITITLDVSLLEVDDESGNHKFIVKANPVTSDGAFAHFTYRWKVDGGELIGLFEEEGVLWVLNPIEQDSFVDAGAVLWIISDPGSYRITCRGRSLGYTTDGEASASVVV